MSVSLPRPQFLLLIISIVLGGVAGPIGRGAARAATGAEIRGPRQLGRTAEILVLVVTALVVALDLPRTYLLYLSALSFLVLLGAVLYTPKPARKGGGA